MLTLLSGSCPAPCLGRRHWKSSNRRCAHDSSLLFIFPESVARHGALAGMLASVAIASLARTQASIPASTLLEGLGIRWTTASPKPIWIRCGYRRLATRCHAVIRSRMRIGPQNPYRSLPQTLKIFSAGHDSLVVTEARKDHDNVHAGVDSGARRAARISLSGVSRKFRGLSKKTRSRRPRFLQRKPPKFSAHPR